MYFLLKVTSAALAQRTGSGMEKSVTIFPLNGKHGKGVKIIVYLTAPNFFR